MTRNLLLRTLSVAAVAAAHAPAFAQTPAALNGGGATQTQYDWQDEEALFNSQQTAVQFGSYWASGSGTGQKAFITDDLSCDINGATGNNGGACTGATGGADTVQYGASDSPLTAAQVSSWATASAGQSAAGNLIQIPTMGTSTGIVINDTNITANGELVLSDNDLCGIFSGKITNFNQLTDVKKNQPAPGNFQLVYRTDSAAATFLLTNHLAAVCNSGNTASGVTFKPTTTFASLFGVPITNQIPGAVGEKLSSGVADYMAGLVDGPVPQAIGYLSPDWTSIDSGTSGLVLSNGQPSPLLVAAVSVKKKSFTPTVKNIQTALSHAQIGQNLTPPANASAAANPLNWVPVVQTATDGYPIVGYSNWVVAQCYANPTVTAGVIAFLTSHLTNKSYLTIQANEGLVGLTNTGAAKFLTAVEQALLTNKKGWNTNIGNPTACAGLAGR
jgi:ABC-type phosphate transport system substrate-binding protein